MYRFEKLTVWQKAMDFCVRVYGMTKNFPKAEIFGLTSQLRRASTSIPLNIAEGSACRTKQEFIQFLMIALRSQYEVVTILKLVCQLGFLRNPEYESLQEQVDEIGRLLQALINSLQLPKVAPNN